MRAVVGRDQRLRQHDLDQRRVGRELRGAPQRRDGFGGLAAFEQRLALELVEVRVVRLRLDQASIWPIAARRSAWR